MNNTVFIIVAVMATLALLTSALVIAPALASSGDGNTISKEKNQAKSIASGFGTISANVQANAICALVTTLCI